MLCYLNLPRIVYGSSVAELLERDGVKIDKHVEDLINEVLDENLKVWRNGYIIYASSSIETIYEKVKEKLDEG